MVVVVGGGGGGGGLCELFGPCEQFLVGGSEPKLKGVSGEVGRGGRQKPTAWAYTYAYM